MGLDGEGAQGVAGDDAVLVVAEDALDGLQPLGGLPGRFPERGPGRLRRVPCAFRRFAGVVQGEVAVRARRVFQGSRDAGGEAFVVLVRGAGERLAGRAGRGQQGRVGEECVQGLQQCEVAGAVQHCDGTAAGAAAAGRGPDPQPGPDRAEDQGAGQSVEPGAQPGVEDLLVAVDAELRREPLQLGSDGVGDRAVEDLAVGAEGAAEPAGGDPHPVHGVGQAPAHGGVEGHDVGDLFAYVGEDVVARGARGRAGLPLALLRGRLHLR